MAAGAVEAAPVPTVTDQWVADTADQANIAELCRRLGYPVDRVCGMEFTSGRNGIKVAITRVVG